MSDRLTAREEPPCHCGTEDPKSARYGHSHLSWCPVVRLSAPQPCAGCAALREALIYIRAQIRDFGVQDADDEWYEAVEKVDAWLAQSQPDGVKHE